MRLDAFADSRYRCAGKTSASEELLDLLDFDGDIDLDVEGNRAVVNIDGSDDLTKLVKRKGEVLDALQELTRLAVHQKTGVRSRLILDIASRRRRTAILGDTAAAEAVDRIEYDWTRMRRAMRPGSTSIWSLCAPSSLTTGAPTFCAYPNAVALRLECGMDTRAFRLHPPEPGSGSISINRM